jgi:hypothetical protein
MVNRFRNYSKGKSFKFSIWNELDTYNNDDFVQDWVVFNGKVYVCIKCNTNVKPGTSDHWQVVLDDLISKEILEGITESLTWYEFN